jgi:hypothetical protein
MSLREKRGILFLEIDRGPEVFGNPFLMGASGKRRRARQHGGHGTADASRVAERIEIC